MHIQDSNTSAKMYSQARHLLSPIAWTAHEKQPRLRDCLLSHAVSLLRCVSLRLFHVPCYTQSRTCSSRQYTPSSHEVRHVLELLQETREASPERKRLARHGPRVNGQDREVMSAQPDMITASTLFAPNTGIGQAPSYRQSLGMSLIAKITTEMTEQLPVA